MYEEERESQIDYERQAEQHAMEQEHFREQYIEEQRYQYQLREQAKELTSLIGGTIYKLMSFTDTFNAWLATRPESIQKLAAKYPPGEYKIIKGSPYGITSDGSTVEVITYLESGQLGVLIKAENKSDEALEHEAMLCERYKKSKEEQEKIHKSDVTAHIEPEWLELVTSDLD